jgi:glycine/D-amino acid oxidase-like deaminating enzyme
VVGAGMAGLATALCLLRDGRHVTVIDKQGVGAGETLRTTAHQASALDDRYTRLQRQHGQDGARLAASSHAAAIDWIEELALGSGQDCGFKRVPGYLFAHDRDRQRLDEEAEAARQAGLAAQLCEAGQELPAELGPVIRFEAQARVAMGRFLLILARALHAAGGQFLRAEATAINGGESPSVELRDGTVLTASAVVAAGNVPFHETGATYMKQAPYRSYVVVAEGPREAWPDALIWDDADPYHYVRLLDPEAGSDNVRLILGVRIIRPARTMILRRMCACRRGQIAGSPAPCATPMHGRAKCWSRRTAWPTSAAIPTTTTFTWSLATPATASPMARWLAC